MLDTHLPLCSHCRACYTQSELLVENLFVSGTCGENVTVRVMTGLLNIFALYSDSTREKTFNDTYTCAKVMNTLTDLDNTVLTI